MYIAHVTVGNLGGRDDSGIALEWHSSRFLRLLFEDVFPLWSTLGMDRERGGFHECLAVDGLIPPVARRVRVSARQVYVFAEAARLGLNPTVASACIRHGQRFLQSHSDADGLIAHSLSPEGAVVDEGKDLYDQAFLLLAWASAFGHLGDPAYRRMGLELLASLKASFAYEGGGFVDRTDRPFPLRANPHMHLLEAALAWMAVDDDPAWQNLADEIVDLFQRHFFDRVRGVVREFFGPDWSVLEENGRCRVEPGHNYEWAWLLLRWQSLTGGEAGNHPQRMISFAETYGFDAIREVAINECWSDGFVHDKTARLWPQTERLKAWLAVAGSQQGALREQAERNAASAARGLYAYLNHDARGLWHDVMLEDGSFGSGPSPASSFYHIVCALSELSRYTQQHPVAADELARPGAGVAAKASSPELAL